MRVARLLNFLDHIVEYALLFDIQSTIIHFQRSLKASETKPTRRPLKKTTSPQNLRFQGDDADSESDGGDGDDDGKSSYSRMALRSQRKKKYQYVGIMTHGYYAFFQSRFFMLDVVCKHCVLILYCTYQTNTDITFPCSFATRVMIYQ